MRWVLFIYVCDLEISVLIARAVNDEECLSVFKTRALLEVTEASVDKKGEKRFCHKSNASVNLFILFNQVLYPQLLAATRRKTAHIKLSTILLKLGLDLTQLINRTKKSPFGNLIAYFKTFIYSNVRVVIFFSCFKH